MSEETQQVVSAEACEEQYSSSNNSYDNGKENIFIDTVQESESFRIHSTETGIELQASTNTIDHNGENTSVQGTQPIVSVEACADQPTSTSNSDHDDNNIFATRYTIQESRTLQIVSAETSVKEQNSTSDTAHDDNSILVTRPTVQESQIRHSVAPDDVEILALKINIGEESISMNFVQESKPGQIVLSEASVEQQVTANISEDKGLENICTKTDQETETSSEQCFEEKQFSIDFESDDDILILSFDGEKGNTDADGENHHETPCKKHQESSDITQDGNSGNTVQQPQLKSISKPEKSHKTAFVDCKEDQNVEFPNCFSDNNTQENTFQNRKCDPENLLFPKELNNVLLPEKGEHMISVSECHIHIDQRNNSSDNFEDPKTESRLETRVKDSVTYNLSSDDHITKYWASKILTEESKQIGIQKAQNLKCEIDTDGKFEESVNVNNISDDTVFKERSNHKKTEINIDTTFSAVVNTIIEEKFNKKDSHSIDELKKKINSESTFGDVVNTFIEIEMSTRNQTPDALNVGDKECETDELKSNETRTADKTLNEHFTEISNLATDLLKEAASPCTNTLHVLNTTIPHAASSNSTKKNSNGSDSDSDRSGSKSAISTSQSERSCEEEHDSTKNSLINKVHDKKSCLLNKDDICNDESEGCFDKCTVTGTTRAFSSENLAENFVTIIDSSDEASSQDSEDASAFYPRTQDDESRDIQLPHYYFPAIVHLYKEHELLREEIDSQTNSESTASSYSVIAGICSRPSPETDLGNADREETVCLQKSNNESNTHEANFNKEEQSFLNMNSKGRNTPLIVKDISKIPVYSFPSNRTTLCQPNYRSIPITRLSETYTRTNKAITTLLKDRIVMKRKKMLHKGLLHHCSGNIAENNSQAYANTIPLLCHNRVIRAPIKSGTMGNERQFSNKRRDGNKDVIKQNTNPLYVINELSRIVPDYSHTCLSGSGAPNIAKQSGGLTTTACNSENEHGQIKKMKDKTSDKDVMKLDYAPEKEIIQNPKIDLTALNRLKTAMKNVLQSKNKTDEITSLCLKNLGSVKENGNSCLDSATVEVENIPQVQLHSDLSKLSKPYKNLTDEWKAEYQSQIINGQSLIGKQSNASDARHENNQQCISEMLELIKAGKDFTLLQGKINDNDNFQQTNQNTGFMNQNIVQQLSSGSECPGNSPCLSSQHNNIHVAGDPQNIFIINVNNRCEHDSNCSGEKNDDKDTQSNITVNISKEGKQANEENVVVPKVMFKNKHNATILCESKHTSNMSDRQISNVITISDSESDSEETYKKRLSDDHSSKTSTGNKGITETHIGRLSASQNGDLVIRSIKDKPLGTKIDGDILHKRKSQVGSGEVSILKQLLETPVTKHAQKEKLQIKFPAFGSRSRKETFRNNLNKFNLSAPSNETNKHNHHSPQTISKNNQRRKKSKETEKDKIEQNNQVKATELQLKVSESNNSGKELVPVINNASSHDPVKLNTNKLVSSRTLKPRIKMFNSQDGTCIGEQESIHNNIIDIDICETETDNDIMVVVTENIDSMETKSQRKETTNVSKKELEIVLSDDDNDAENVAAVQSSNDSESEHDHNEFYEELDEAAVYDDDFYDYEKEEIRRKRGKMCSATSSCYVVLSKMKSAFSEDGTLENVEDNHCNVHCRRQFLKSYVSCTH